MQTGFELPVTLRPSKMRTVRFLFIATLFVAAGIWMVFFEGADGYTVDGIPVYWVGWASIVFFGIGGVVFLFQLISGTAYLRLEPEGFTYCSAFRTHTVRWEDVQEFGVMQIHHNRLVGWNYASDYEARAGMRDLPATKHACRIPTG
ncbi:MAG: STM3941 family protein [Chthoniobacteraceae bacterium]